MLPAKSKCNFTSNQKDLKILSASRLLEDVEYVRNNVVLLFFVKTYLVKINTDEV